jgi:peptide/nickel transport system substrate-binding protein
MKRRDFLKTSSAAAGAAAFSAAPFVPARADERSETLLSVAENGPNALDTEVVGANRAVYEVVWNTYDRLVTFGLKKDANGNDYYDDRNIQPELAEDVKSTDASLTFKLRKDAKFHDGTPVTAKDVKWSFDRALGVGGYPKFIFNSVSMTNPEQFVAVDDHTFRFDFIKRDNYTLPYIAAPVGFILNSELVKKNATPNDPWGREWTKNNVAGSGAYKIERWTPGQDVIYARNEDWNRGPKPKLRRVIARIVPAAATRRALTERGDVDFSFEMPPKDASDLASNRKLKVISAPMDNTVVFLSMNMTIAPFDNLKVRQAVSLALPYDEIVQLALFGRAKNLAGGSGKITNSTWPQPGPYKTDLDEAKKLLAEAGFPNGFETTLSYDLGNAVTDEPTCILIQRSLAKIGIKVNLNKIPGANWRAELTTKKLPFLVHTFGAWLSYPYFYFGYVYRDKTALHDTAVYQNPAMDTLIDESHYNPDPKVADAAAVRYIQMAYDELPFVPLYQPSVNCAMQKNISGYSYWFFRQLDYRKFVKA